MLGQLTILSYNRFDERLLTFIKSHNLINAELYSKIRITRKSALRNIVNSYRKFILDFQRNRDFEKMESIPEMPMNRKTIARLVGCCEKTAYNHLLFMQRAGILKKNLHGRQNNFGVILNPYFWLMEAEYMPKINMGCPPEATFSEIIMQNLPPISLKEFQEGYNYYNADVETVDKTTWETTTTTSPQFQGIDKTIIFSRKSIEQPEKGYIYAQILQDKEIGAAAAELSTELSMSCLKSEKTLDDFEKNKDKSNGTTVGGNIESVGHSKIAPTIPDNQAEGWALVHAFTKNALNKLYFSNQFNKNFYLSEFQFDEIKQLVMNDVFNNFQGVTQDVWAIRQRYTDAVLAIEKAFDYGTKHHWISFLHPKCYFSKKFYNSGKRGTFFEILKWQEQNKHQIEDLKKSDFLEKAKYHVLFNKPPRGRRDLTSPIQISQYFRIAVAKRCGAVYVSQFNQFLINPKNFTKQ